MLAGVSITGNLVGSKFINDEGANVYAAELRHNPLEGHFCVSLV